MTEKSREQKARRGLKREGYFLMKSRVQNIGINNQDGYMIYDSNNYCNAGANFNLSLDDVERFVKS